MKRDSNGNPIVVGMEYMTGVGGHRAKTRVRIEETPETDLIVVCTRSGQRMRLDEMATNAVFEPATDDMYDDGESMSKSIRDRLIMIANHAARARESLDQCEQAACDLVGVAVGDESELSDYILHFIRDGYGDVDQLMSRMEFSCSEAAA